MIRLINILTWLAAVFMAASIILCVGASLTPVDVLAQRAGRMGVLIEDANGVDHFVQDLVFNSVKKTVGTANADITVDLSIYPPSTTQVIDATSDAILANALIVVLNPDADYTTDTTPIIADGTTGQILYITCANGETNRVRVRDQDTLASSNLQLSEQTHDLSGKDVLTLIFDGTDWIEQSYVDN